MLPFVQQKIGARKLLIYSDASSRHPISAIELTNSTGKTLDGGPVTVFESASYAGEALMATLKAGDKRLIGYALDLGTRVTTKLDSGEEDIREIHLRRGVLTVRRADRSTHTWTIRNVDNRAKTLVIEHPIRREYKLIDVKPAETTGTAYRFEVPLPAGGEKAFTMSEEREFDNTVTISSITPPVLASYIGGRGLSAAGRKALEAIAGLKSKIEDVQRQSRSIEGEIGTIDRDSERTRQNILSLNAVSGQGEQVQRYARQLASLDTRLAALRETQGKLTAERAALEGQLSQLIDATTF